MSAGLILVGALFLLLLRNRVALDSNELSAQYLGYLLIFIGGSALLINERIAIELRKESGFLFFSSTSIFGTKKQTVTFASVDRVSISRVGRARNNVQFYFLHLHLKNGTRLPTGMILSSAESAQAEADRISEIIGCPSQQIALPSDHRFSTFLLAFVVGVIAYAVYYRISVGPPCKAMWFGTAPPVIIMLVTWFTYGILRTNRSPQKD